jgi:small subunit ribosomal protein S17
MKGKLEELSMEEIDRSLKESKEELRKQRFKSVTSKVENPKKIKGLKKHIARILTLKREYDLGITAIMFRESGYIMAKNRKQLIGKVVSNKMDKTIVVEIENLIMHPLYKKSVQRTKKIKSHDAKNECSVGDIVRVEETRPLSKEKHYRLIQIVEKAK